MNTVSIGSNNISDFILKIHISTLLRVYILTLQKCMLSALISQLHKHHPKRIEMKTAYVLSMDVRYFINGLYERFTFFIRQTQGLHCVPRTRKKRYHNHLFCAVQIIYFPTVLSFIPSLGYTIHAQIQLRRYTCDKIKIVLLQRTLSYNVHVSNTFFVLYRLSLLYSV